jgi:hypothetical protein
MIFSVFINIQKSSFFFDKSTFSKKNCFWKLTIFRFCQFFVQIFNFLSNFSQNDLFFIFFLSFSLKYNSLFISISKKSFGIKYNINYVLEFSQINYNIYSRPVFKIYRFIYQILAKQTTRVFF